MHAITRRHAPPRPLNTPRRRQASVRPNSRPAPGIRPRSRVSIPRTPSIHPGSPSIHPGSPSYPPIMEVGLSRSLRRAAREGGEQGLAASSFCGGGSGVPPRCGGCCRDAYGSNSSRWSRSRSMDLRSMTRVSLSRFRYRMVWRMPVSSPLSRSKWRVMHSVNSRLRSPPWLTR